MERTLQLNQHGKRRIIGASVRSGCRTLDDRTDGVVITFTEITAAKTLEAQLREKHTALERLIAKQSAKPESAGVKVSAKTMEPKWTRPGVNKSAAPAN